MFLALTFIFRRHPIIFIRTILIQTILICILIWWIIRTTWFSYILFLIFLGGLIVLFIYVTRLASNEKFNFNINLSINISIALLFIILIISFYFKHQERILFIFNLKINLKEMFNYYNAVVLLLTIIYLLLTLIVVVKIISKNNIPVRNAIFY